MPKKPKQPRPVKLQANLAGAWKDVAHFDASDDNACGDVLAGAEQICKATSTRFRIVMRESPQEVLMHCSPEKGWEQWK